MDNLIIINSLYKKRGIFRSLFFNAFFRQIYFDDSFSYNFEVKDLSKINKKFLKDVIEIISKEAEEGYIKTSSIENEEESLVLFSSIKKEELNKKLLLLKECRIRADVFCPSEYLVGKYFAEKFKNRNVQVTLILKDRIYTSFIDQGNLLWIEKNEDKEINNSDRHDFFKNDIFDKEIVTEERLKQIMLDTIKPKKIEILFKKWVDSLND